MRRIEPLVVDPIPTSAQVAALGRVLDDDHRGGCLLPVPAGPEGDRLASEVSGRAVPDDAVLAVATTGSTGTPKVVLHSRATLLASINSTATRVGGHGAWLLCLGINHIAGIQVVLRAKVAGTAPVVAPAGGPSFADDFAAAAARPTAARRYVSLVPTQLQRLLDSPAREALTRFDAILLGGAAADPQLLSRSRDAGATVVTTYGMSETGGGCVYDGVPLDGVEIGTGDDGVVRLTGDLVALGYLQAPDPDPFDGRTFTTSDLGEIVDGRLRIVGRADDIINTGAKKVAPLRVEQALRALPAVADTIVVGVPDDNWGQRVVALVVPASDATLPLDEVRDALRGRLADHELPREVITLDALPYKGIGKPDRAAALELATSRRRLR
ncbi:AMP-binding protein [Cumulibacter manganitolerans]|uniref:AMP-binding protein n=1 Tax=Cumulibacter manganitolerans TaxID=1884992 RepID=UPI001296FFC0|nr:AMP-binding protein [Cumulibacter manganitolerans]